jgi:hypothetical protein
MVGKAVLEASSVVLITVFPFDRTDCHVFFTTNIRVKRIARGLEGGGRRLRDMWRGSTDGTSFRRLSIKRIQ